MGGYRIGDKVQWTSQAGGYRATKRGEVVEVVAEGKSPESPLRNPGGARDHVSYVVRTYEVQRFGRVSKNVRLYWPRAASLSPVK